MAGGLFAARALPAHAQEDGLPLISIASDKDTVVEDGTVTFTLTRTGDTAETLTVGVSRREPNGPTPTDIVTHQVTFEAGSETADFSVRVRDDGVIESDDWLEVEIDSGAEYRLGEPYRLTVTINDPLVVMTVSADQESVTEGEEVSYTLSRAGSTTHAMPVNVSVSDPGAFLRGNHWSPEPVLPTTVEFAVGVETATLSFRTSDDWRDIADSDVTVSIVAADHYELGPTELASASVRVTDNDVAPALELDLNETTVEEGETLILTLRRSGTFVNPTETTVAYGFQGEEQETFLFVLDDPEPSLSLQIRTDDNDLDEPDRVFEATILPISEDSPVPEAAEAEYWTVQGDDTVTATVTDNDLPLVRVEAVSSSYEEGEIGKVWLRRIGDTTGVLNVTVVVSQSRGATDQGWTMLTVSRKFNPGVSQTTSNYLFPENDGDEPDGFLSVAIQPGVGYRIDPAASTARLTVEDTDPTPVLSIEDAGASEDGGTIEFVVRLAGPPSSQAISLDFATEDGTATAGSDYTASSGTFTLQPGEQAGTIAIPVVADTIGEYDETFSLIVSAVTNAALLDGEDSVTLTGTIEDDEPFVSLTANADTVTEGETAVFTLSRTGDAANALTVRLAVVGRGIDPPDEYPLLTFSPGEATVTLEVPTADDDRDAPTALLSALLFPPSSAGLPPSYRVSSTAAVVNVHDNDLPRVTITAAGLGTEGEPAVFTLDREGDVSGELTVNVQVTADEGLVSGAPPSTAVFGAGERTVTLSIPTVEDSTVEDGGSVTAAVLSGAAYRIGEPGSATFLVLDDDGSAPLVMVSAEERVVFEGEDIVFVFARSGVRVDQELTAYVNVHKQAYVGHFYYTEVTSTAHEVVFEAGSPTVSLVYPTVDDPGNNGNHLVKAVLNLGQYTFQSGSNASEVWVRDDDIPTVSMGVETDEIIEGPDATQFTMRRTGDTTYDLNVWWLRWVDERWPEGFLSPHGQRISDRDRIPWRFDQDYPGGTVFTFAEDESEQTERLDPRYVGPLGATSYLEILPRYCGDDVPGDCGYEPQYLVGTPKSSTIEVLSSDMGVRVEAAQESVSEGGGATFTMHRYGGTRTNRISPLTVRVEVTQNGEFIEGVPPQTVTFGGTPSEDTNINTPDGELSKTVIIPTTDDMLDEADGAITLTILPPDPDLIGDPQQSYEIFGTETYLADSGYTNVATVTITDNDVAAVTIADAVADEDAGNIEFMVIAVASTSAISVNWETKDDRGDNPATEGEDYVAASGSVTFAPGETTKTISVALLDDDLSEPDETFSIVLSNPAGATLDDPEATGTIDNDDVKQIILPLEGADHGPVVEGQSVVFQLERFSWVLGSIPIQDEPRGRLVMEAVVTQDGKFISGTAPTTVVFKEGEWTTTVVVPTVDDDVFEDPGSVSLGIVHLGWHVRAFLDPIEVTVWDNDMPVSIGDDQEVEEDAGEITFTVSLEEPAVRPVTVYATTVDGDPTSNGAVSQENLGKDFEARSEWLTFEEGEQTKQFTVTVLDDADDEATAETFSVELRNPTNGRLVDGSATGRIMDNDQRMNVVLVPPAYKRHDEDSGPVTFYLELVHERTRSTRLDTSVDWSVTAGTASLGEDYVEVSGTADIPAGHFSRTFEVTVVDDDLFEEKFETFTVELTGAQGLGLVDSQKSVEINIRDNERLSATVTADAVSVSEGEDAVFTVSLEGGRTTGPTVITYEVEGTAAAADYTAPNGTLTILAGDRTGSVTIPTLTDSVVDPDETLVVELIDATSLGRAVRTRGRPATTTILDQGTLSASVAGGEATEGESVPFTVTLSAATDAAVDVQWETADAAEDTAAAGVDYQTTSGTVTILAEATSATFTVATLQDRLAEPEEQFGVTLTGATRSSQPVALGVSTAVGTITDDDEPPTGVGLLAVPDTVAEGSGEVLMHLTAGLRGADGEPSATILPVDTVVSVTLADGTATAGEDYLAEPFTLTIPAGSITNTTPVTVPLTVVDDQVVESDETLQVTGTASGLEVTPVEVTITDDDTAPTGVTLTVTPEELAEGAGATELTVSAVFTGGDARLVDTPITLSVEGAALPSDGDSTTTAATADDFTFAPATLTIPAGELVGTAGLTLTPVDDQVTEGDETARVMGSADSLTVTPAPITITDNDRQATAIALSLAESQFNEGDGTADLRVTATLVGGGARTVDTLVSLSVHDVTATAGSDYSAPSNLTLTIPAGSLHSEADTLTVTVIDDDLYESTEQLAVRGTNDVPGLPVSGIRASIADNDVAPTRIRLSLDRNRVREDGGLQSLTVTGTIEGASKRTVDTIITLTASNQTATEEDYSAVPGELRITAGSSEGTAKLLLDPVDDALDEDDETLQVGGTAVRSGLLVSTQQVTITDDDTTGVTVSRTALTVPEGASNSYTVVLDAQPSADVIVTVGGASGDVSANPTTLTFTPDNWSVPQTVTVTAGEDDDAVADAQVTLTHTVSGGDYGAVTAKNVTVTVTENDTRGLTVSETTLTVPEGGTKTYTVKLDTAPSDDVTVEIGGASGDVSVNPTPLTFTP